MKMRKYKWIEILSIAVVLTIGLIGCAPKAHLNVKTLPLPESYSHQVSVDSFSLAKIGWKSFFPDTILQNYIRHALANNHSFLNTLEKISMAQNNVRLKKGALFPSLSLGVGASVERFGNYTMDGIGSNPANYPNIGSANQTPNPYSDFNIGIGFQWEIDIWGKLTQRRKAAANRWLASVEAAKMAQTLLISELAVNYFELIGLDKQGDIITKAIEKTEKSCHLTSVLKEEGELSQLAVDQFEARLLRLKGMLIDNQLNIRSRERAICLLMSTFPQELNRVRFQEIESFTFRSQVGLPAQLLSLRPDIKEAEMELLATKYDVSAARKAFFPSLTLGGSGGFNAFDIAQWFIAPASLVYSLGAGLTAPLFNRNELSVLFRNAESHQKIALNHYHETIIKAYSEVAGLLQDSELIRQHKELEIKEIEVGRNATVSANDLFRLQFIGYLEVLVAEEEYFKSQLDYTALMIDYCKIQAHLYRALGGGVF